jgi:YD repeat-containing protein
LVRQTLIDYANVGSHIVDHVSLESTYDGAGHLMVQTQNIYDGVAVTGTGGSAPAHDYTNYAASFNTRGNLTSPARWWNINGGFLTTSFTYDDLGNRLSSKDAAGNVSNLSYTHNFNYVALILEGGP